MKIKIPILVTIVAISATYAKAQWQQTSAPSTSQVRSIAISGPNIFAGYENGHGVYRSTNNGAVWTPANNGLGGSAIYALAIKDTNIYAGTDGGGMFLSTNNGNTWTAINNGLPIGYNTYIFIYSIVIDGSKIYVGTSNGVYVSNNNGGGWTAANTGLPNGESSMSIIKYGTIFFTSISNGHGVYRSTNNGNSWVPVNTGLPSGNCYVSTFGISGSNIFAGDQTYGLFSSNNNGNSWTNVNYSVSDFSVRTIEVSGTNIFVGTQHGKFLSNDNGNSWVSINDGMSGNGANSFGINNTTIFAGTFGGVWNRPLSEITDCFTSYSTSYDSIQNTFTLNVDSASTATAITYHWDFGDGATSTLATPSHIYTTDSLYNVCMKIFTTSGDSCSYCHIIGIDSSGNIIRTTGFTLVVQKPNMTTNILNKKEEETKIKVFPNPTNGIVTINGSNLSSIEIYNLIGEKIYNQSNLKQQTSNEIDLSKSQKGIYFVKIYDGIKMYSQKIIVQ